MSEVVCVTRPTHTQSPSVQQGTGATWELESSDLLVAEGGVGAAAELNVIISNCMGPFFFICVVDIC